MIKRRADAAAHGVGQAETSADVLHEAGREAAAEDFVEDFDGEVVRISAVGAERDHAYVRLVHVVFTDQVVAGLGRMDFDFRFRSRRTLWPGCERSLQLGFHGGGIEVTADADDDVVGLNVLLVPVEKVVALDRENGGVFRLARVRTVGSVGELDRFACGDRGGIVVAACDGFFELALGEFQLVGAELGIVQEVEDDLEDVVVVGLQTRPADGGGVDAAAGFDLCGARFEIVVHLIAGLRFGAAGAPDFAIEIDEADFRSGLLREPPRMRMEPSISGSSWSSCRKITMPLGRAMRLGSAGMERGQRRNGDLLPTAFARGQRWARQRRSPEARGGQGEKTAGD